MGFGNRPESFLKIFGQKMFISFFNVLAKIENSKILIFFFQKKKRKKSVVSMFMSGLELIFNVHEWIGVGFQCS